MQVLESFATFVSNGREWILELVVKLSFNSVKYQPLSGSSYMKLIAKTRQFIQGCKALEFQKTAVKQQKSKASFTGRL